MNLKKAQKLKKIAENTIKIIDLLVENRLIVTEIARILDVNSSLISYYKKQLKDEGENENG